MSDINYVSLSKAMCKALRHRPERIGITLAPDGSIEVAKLIDALNRRGGWPRTLNEHDIMHVVQKGTKNRFAVKDGRIRARYGHSIPLQIAQLPAEPPAVLYHGTSEANVLSIFEKGLLPMGRQDVHLSTDVETARQVGLRHGGRLALLRVDAQRAAHDGIEFCEGNESTWLAKHVPATYLHVMQD